MNERKPQMTREMPAGVTIGHYKIVRKLGEGGMGVVFVAEDTRLRRTVALKVLHGDVTHDSERRYRFLREGRLAAGLTHPCIATVFEVGEADEHLFIAMELVEGRHVGALLDESEHGYLKIFQALRITREVVRGLVKAHEAGIIHRDLKPENVMYGEDQVVKILDFGVAKRTDEASAEVTAHATKQGSLIGTPAYMSPEQAAGRALDARSDIFSVGVMLYEMLTGKRPFQGETWQEIIISIARDPLVPASVHRPELPATIDRVLGLCLEKKADDRFPSARALLDELEGLLLDAAPGQNASDAVDVITRVVAGSRGTTAANSASRTEATRTSAGAAKTELALATDPTAPPASSAEAEPEKASPSKLPLLAFGSAVLAGLVSYFVLSKGSATSTDAAGASSTANATTMPTTTASSAGAGSASVSSPASTAPAQPTASVSASVSPSATAASIRLPTGTPTGKLPPSSPAPATPTAGTKPSKTNPVLGF